MISLFGNSFQKSVSRNFLHSTKSQVVRQQKRFFDLHEYHSKFLMGQFGINVQKGQLAKSAEEAAKVASQLSNKGGLILKAQVQAGGRGKGKLTSGLKGGVQICKTPQEIQEKTKLMLGYNLITHQTPPEGLLVKSVLVHEGVDIDKQIYLAFLHDRKNSGICCVSSTKGGMDIEEVAKEDPDAIKVYPIDFKKGIQDKDAERIVDSLGLEGKTRQQGIDQLKKMYDMFLKIDASQIEVNPWAITPDNDLYCIDAKINIDDNALFRHKDILEMHKKNASSADVDVNEQKAVDAGLNYIALDGNIGCMVNGAGLAMATMDIIQQKGGSPANFLDVGGGATTEQVKTGFEILTQHPKVKAILVNIFGGIMKCDIIAEGIIKAAQQVKINVPVVVRLTGTNSVEAKKLIDQFAEQNKDKVNLIVQGDFDKAATTVVDQVVSN